MNIIVFYKKNKVLSIILILVVIIISVVALNIGVGLLLILILWINNKKTVKKGKEGEKRLIIEEERSQKPERSPPRTPQEYIESRPIIEEERPQKPKRSPPPTPQEYIESRTPIGTKIMEFRSVKHKSIKYPKKHYIPMAEEDKIIYKNFPISITVFKMDKSTNIHDDHIILKRSRRSVFTGGSYYYYIEEHTIDKATISSKHSNFDETHFSDIKKNYNEIVIDKNNFDDAPYTFILSEPLLYSPFTGNTYIYYNKLRKIQ